MKEIKWFIITLQKSVQADWDYFSVKTAYYHCTTDVHLIIECKCDEAH